MCAMYEVHNGQPSTRFHDLVDLVLIVTNWPIDALIVRIALRTEAVRRSLTLPNTITLPASTWTAGYERSAKTVIALPTAAHTVDGALRIVGEYLNPILDDEVASFRRVRAALGLGDLLLGLLSRGFAPLDLTLHVATRHTNLRWLVGHADRCLWITPSTVSCDRANFPAIGSVRGGTRAGRGAGWGSGAWGIA